MSYIPPKSIATVDYHYSFLDTFKSTGHDLSVAKQNLKRYVAEEVVSDKYVKYEQHYDFTDMTLSVCVVSKDELFDELRRAYMAGIEDGRRGHSCMFGYEEPDLGRFNNEGRL